MKKIILISLSLALWIGCGGSEHPKSEVATAPPVKVRTLATGKTEWANSYEATGTVRARTTATISPRVMGYVREVKFQVGDRVSPGQLLVVLDARELESGQRQAEAGLSEARSALPEVNNAVAGAQAQLDLAKATFKRMQDLFEKKSISNQEFDEAQARLKVAESGHAMAVSKRSQLEAKIRQAEAAVASAKINSGWAEIRAPFAGIIIEKRVEPGNLTAPGTPLATLEQSGSFRFEAEVAESRLPSVRLGQGVNVRLDALDRSIPARVSEIVPAVDAASRAFIVKIDLPGVPQLRSGLFGRATFPLGARQVLAIPSDAVIEQGQLRSVLVAEDGMARSRLVTLGDRSGGMVEVLSGLDGGEKLIHPSPPGLVDGTRVEVQP